MIIIIGQQISTKAQSNIWEKIQQQVKMISAETIADLPVEILQGIELSLSKINYVQEIAQKILVGDVNLEILKTLEDQAVRNFLLPLKGIDP